MGPKDGHRPHGPVITLGVLEPVLPVNLQDQAPARPKAWISLLTYRHPPVNSPQNRPARLGGSDCSPLLRVLWLTGPGGTHSGPCVWSFGWPGCLFTSSPGSDSFRGSGCQAPGAGRTPPLIVGPTPGGRSVGGRGRGRARPGRRTQASREQARAGGVPCRVLFQKRDRLIAPTLRHQK